MYGKGCCGHGPWGHGPCQLLGFLLSGFLLAASAAFCWLLVRRLQNIASACSCIGCLCVHVKGEGGGVVGEGWGGWERKMGGEELVWVGGGVSSVCGARKGLWEG
jgi:hypothetical protein